MNAGPPAIDQVQLTGIICERPQNFAWFLGAGASRSAGLPTATDIIWNLKRRYYCQQENEDISRQDVHLVYKEGALKPAPSPVMVRRLSGAGGWHETCAGIIGLTKMDWNNNTLYKKLPATLGLLQGVR